MCLLTNERYKTYQTGFPSRRLGQSPGGTEGGGGVWGQFFFDIQPNLVCELLTCMSHATAQFFWSPPHRGPGEGPKVQISLIFY